MNLNDKVAVVTGASYGLGKSTTEMLLKNNFKVYGVSRTKPDIQNKEFVWINADLYKVLSIKNIFSTIKETKIDLLVNNAGTHIEQLTSDFTLENYNKLFNLNFVSPILVTKFLRNKLHGGLVLNISSTSDRFSEEGSGLYSATKAALDIFFDTFATENKDIKVINILPDYVDTPLQHKISDSVKTFDWAQTTKSEEVSMLIKDLINGKYKLETKTKVIVVNDKTIDDTKDPEKLWYYNVDNGKMVKLK